MWCVDNLIEFVVTDSLIYHIPGYIYNFYVYDTTYILKLNKLVILIVA